MLDVSVSESSDEVSFCCHCGKELRMQYINVLGEDIPIGMELCSCEKSEQERALEVEKMKAQDLAKSNEALREKIEKQQIKAGVGRKYLKCTMPSKYIKDKMDMSFVFKFTEAIKKNETSNKPWLYISGGYGSGKTSLAAAIVYHVIADQERNISEKKRRKRKKILFVTPSNIFRDIMLSFKSDSKTSVEIFDLYSSCDLLVIDDIGKNTSSDFRVDVLFDVLDARDKEQLPTIFTSNWMAGDQLIRRLLPKDDDSDAANAIVSRIIGNSIMVNLLGKDERLK